MDHRIEAESYKLYVADISPNADANDLSKIFCQYGKVIRIEVRASRNAARDPLSNATVTFRKKEEAEKAFNELNGAIVKGLPIRVMWFIKDRSLRYGSNVVITNLDKDILQEQIATDRKGNSLGYAFVSFANEADAEAFINKIDGSEIGRNIVRVTKCLPKSRRFPGAESGKFNNCYVKRFGPDLTSEELKKMFDKFGDIINAHVMRDESGRSRRFGFVAFEEPSSAEAAVHEMNGKLVNGKCLYVGRAMKRAERDEYILKKFGQQPLEKGETYIGNTIYVKNLDRSINEIMLKKYFGECGTILRAWIATDGSGSSRGFGFVQFSSQSEALRAIELSGQTWRSKAIHVALLQIREERDEIQKAKKDLLHPKQQPLMQTPIPNGGRLQLMNHFPAGFINGPSLVS
ncbi:hypothetical protein Aperf_G00000038214 [Anoplocephala perfoliata]